MRSSQQNDLCHSFFSTDRRWVTRPLLVMALLFSLSMVTTTVGAQEVQRITSVDQIHRVPVEDLRKGIPVELECVVVAYEPDWAILFVHDGKNGYYAGDVRDLKLKIGDQICIRGTLNFNRVPVNATYDPSDNGISLPPSKPVEFEWLQSGKEDSQFVEIVGQLVGIGSDHLQTSLEMRTENGGRFRGLIHSTKVKSSTLRAMLGKKLRLRGTVGARFDEFSRWSGFQIWLGVTENFEVIGSEVTEVIPFTPLEELTADKIDETKSNYFRSGGTATYQLSPSMLLLQHGVQRLFVEINQAKSIELERSYEVSGTLDTSVEPAILRMAELIPIERDFAYSTKASHHNIEELVVGDFSGRLVKTTGTYFGNFQLKEQNGFLMEYKGNLLPVFLDASSLDAVAAGTRVDVTGIWVQQKSLLGFNIGSYALHAHKKDVQLGTQIPWLVLSVLGIAGAITFGASFWAFALKQQVRKRTEQFLNSVALQRRTEERYADIFINAQVMVMTTDCEGKITAVNPAALRATGLREQELVGSDVTGLVQEESVPTLRHLISSAARTEQALTSQVRILGRDGSVLPLEVCCWGATTSGSNHLHLIWHDISKRLQMEQQKADMEQRMMSMQKMESLGVLAGGIAHDFNNLLTVVVGNASLLATSPFLSNDDKESVVSIQDASTRAAELTQQMLAYAGRGRFDIRVLDISGLVSEMAQLLMASVSKRIPVRFQLEEDLPGVKADATQLKQILLNLVRNASEAMSGQVGSIRIATSTIDHLPMPEPKGYFVNFTEPCEKENSSSFVTLEVSDDGDGIDSSSLSSIFDPFFSTKFSGRGLGLSTVLGIVRGHHGCIQVRSDKGVGTTFRIYLPSCTAPITSVLTSHFTSRRVEHPFHVVAVDDEPSILLVIAKTLESAGIRVTCCNSGGEALGILNDLENEVDCLITDQIMPEMTGLELCKAIESLRPSLPILLCSGYIMDQAASGDFPKGVKCVLRKPFQSDEFIEQVLKVVVDSSAISNRSSAGSVVQ